VFFSLEVCVPQLMMMDSSTAEAVDTKSMDKQKFHIFECNKNLKKEFGQMGIWSILYFPTIIMLSQQVTFINQSGG